jgi:hypothetical protein
MAKLEESLVWKKNELCYLCSVCLQLSTMCSTHFLQIYRLRYVDYFYICNMIKDCQRNVLTPHRPGLNYIIIEEQGKWHIQIETRYVVIAPSRHTTL